MSLIGGLGRVLPSMTYRHNSDRQCTWTEFVLNEHKFTALCCLNKHKVTALCCQKLGAWEMSYIAHCFSVREDDFHMTLDVGCWMAALYQLMVMLDGNLVTGYPHTMGPTLGAKFVLQVVPLPLMGDGLCSGPTVGVDRKL